MSIIQNGEKFSFADITGTYDKLPVGNYMLKYSEREGFFLVKKEAFNLPSKVYGDQSIINRWLNSWKHNSHKNLGILLTGLKGSGKTITAQKFCIESNLPVIIISDGFSGSDFVDFITNPKLGECIIFIDEFEKIYSEYNRDVSQHDLLSIMDGNFSTRLIFLLTVNSENLNEYLVNRLNRIKYRKSYSDLEHDVVDAVIDDMLINKEHRESIYTFFEKVNMRTFDLLTNLIKEMNLFNEDAITCGMHLNLRSQDKNYEVFEIFNGKEYECYHSSFSPANKIIEVERKQVNYINGNAEKRSYDEEVLVSHEDDFDDYVDNVSYGVHLNLEECKIERIGKNIVVENEDGFKFRFKEIDSKMSLVF
jgi:predicted transcriptional regulator